MEERYVEGIKILKNLQKEGKTTCIHKDVKCLKDSDLYYDYSREKIHSLRKKNCNVISLYDLEYGHYYIKDNNEIVHCNKNTVWRYCERTNTRYVYQIKEGYSFYTSKFYYRYDIQNLIDTLYKLLKKDIENSFILQQLVESILNEE